MRRLLCAVLLLTALTSAARAAVYLAFEQITVTNSAIGFTAAKINNTDGSHPAAVQASCRLRTAEVSYTIDGTTPTASVGTLLEVGDTLLLNGPDILNTFRAIRTGATSGQLDCTYSR